ncbi:MAG: Ig-like domain-containing protein [Deltaproteobacteria bacterium]|nr:Ig-like domain-containing protein [Deltaproteobacteria bacterium]
MFGSHEIFAKSISQSAYYVTEESKSIYIVLVSYSDNDEKLEFIIVDQPAHGKIKGTPPNLTYTPEPGYNGVDRFTFKGLDKSGQGQIGTITITVGSGGVYSAGELQEAFIQLRVKKESGNQFYRVMIDKEERPYLDLEDFLKSWLELSPQCEVFRNFCQVTIHAKERAFWIDGRKQRMGNDHDEAIQSLDLGGLILKDDKLWLRYDIWSRWLPLSSTWNVEEYRLNMTPNFNLVSEITKVRKQIRQFTIQEQHRKKGLAALKAIEPTSDFSNELRYRVYNEQYLDKKQRNTGISFDLNSDIYGGTLQVSGSAYQFVQQAKSDVDIHTTWSYKRKNQPYIKLIEVGDLFLESSLLFPSVSVTGGLRLQRLINKQGADKMAFKGTTIPGTEVELYRSGFFMESVIAGPDGVYQFREIFSSGGEMVRIRFFFPDGSSKDEAVLIAPDSGYILAESNWDSILFHGTANFGDFTKLGLSYGLSDNISAGIMGYHINENNRGSDLNGFYVAFRPFYGLHLLSEGFSSDEGRNFGLMAELTYFQPHMITLKMIKQSETSLLNRIQNPDQKGTDSLQVRYNLSLGSWLLLSDLKKDEYSDSMDVNLRKQFGSYWSVYTNPRITKDAFGVQTTQNITGFEYNSNLHSMRVSRTLNSNLSSSSFRYRFSGKKKIPFDVSFSLIKPDKNEVSFEVTCTWRPYDGLSALSTVRDDGVMAGASYNGLISGANGPDRWEDFAMGTLRGRVLLPEDKDGLQMPVEGVVVMAGSHKGVSDSKGNYRITGLPVDQRLEVKLDSGSLDIGMASKKESEIVFFRPGTSIEYNPQLQKTVGLDGIVKWRQKFSPEDRIEIYSLENQVLTGEVPVEEDGFFIIENLRPGTYYFKLKGVPTSGTPFVIEISPGEVWLSNIEVYIND